MIEDLPNKNNFYEIQQFREVWVWAIIFIVLYALILPVLIGIVSILPSIILVSIGFGFFWLFYRMYLLTVIKEDGIQIKFFPFTDFIIPFNKIKDYKIREYRPIIDYGGWGIRFNKSGKACSSFVFVATTNLPHISILTLFFLAKSINCILPS